MIICNKYVKNIGQIFIIKMSRSLIFYALFIFVYKYKIYYIDMKTLYNIIMYNIIVLYLFFFI